MLCKRVDQQRRSTESDALHMSLTLAMHALFYDASRCIISSADEAGKKLEERMEWSRENDAKREGCTFPSSHPDSVSASPSSNAVPPPSSSYLIRSDVIESDC